jgi:aspartate racemase
MLPGLVAYSPVEIVVVFNPATPDRTAAITSGAASPVPHLRDSALLLQRMGASHIVYACNTAHYFIPSVLRSAAEYPPLRVPIVDMIDATVEVAATARITRVGLLATTGTLEAGLYQEALRKKGIELLLPSSAEQEGLVMEAVYGAHGVKAGLTTGIARQLAEQAAERLVDRGAEGIILGCTELPLIITRVRQPPDGRPIVLINSAKAVAERLRAMGGNHGIAGGLGPDATVAFLETMGAPADLVELQRDILRATRDELGATRDQDHLKMLCIVSRDPVDAARRLARAGAGFLVMAGSAAGATREAAAAARVPALAARRGQRLGTDVVLRAARPQRATSHQ